MNVMEAHWDHMVFGGGGGRNKKKSSYVYQPEFLDKYIKANLKKLGKGIKKYFGHVQFLTTHSLPRKVQVFISNIHSTSLFIFSFICSFTLAGRDVHNKDSKPRRIF